MGTVASMCDLPIDDFPLSPFAVGMRNLGGRLGFNLTDKKMHRAPGRWEVGWVGLIYNTPLLL